MSAMSELSAEREEALNDARQEYETAFTAYMSLIERWPPAHRKPSEQEEISRAEGRCTIAHMHYENAKAQRYKVTNAKV